MNNKVYDCYGEQRIGFKYYKQSVIDFVIHEKNKLSKEINRFKELCDKTQLNNKNKDIDYSLNNFKNFLELMSKEYDKDISCNNFYWSIFIKFVERVKQIYKSTKPMTIDTNTIKFSYIFKGLFIQNNKIKYLNQINYLINNENIEWNKEDKETFKQFIKKDLDKLNEENKEFKEQFSNYRDKIINFKLNYKDDIYEQTKDFYYLCDEIQKLNKINTNLSLIDVYDIVNIIIDGYYYGQSQKNIIIVKFYYNLLFQFIKRIQTLFIQTKKSKNITIDTNTVNFTIIIQKVCNENGHLKYKNQALKFIEECKDLTGWKKENKAELIDWLNSFNKN